MNEALCGVPQAVNIPFSRANLFGIFVTLLICQLTQPYGSLLFPDIGGFAWRCNPFASFTEACIIAWHLLAVVWESWRGGIHRKARLIQRLRETAGALLLLRGAAGDDTGLVQKLMSEEFRNGNNSPLSRLLPDDEQTGEPGTYDEEGIELDEIQPNRQSSRASGSEPVQPSSQNGILRRTTTGLESNRPTLRNHTLPAFERSSEQSRLLHEAFGSNALAHREIRIDIWTGLSVILGAIKMLSVSGAPFFRTAAILMTIGWFLVQSLLLLFHWRDLTELEWEASWKAAQKLNDYSRRTLGYWKTFFVLLHLPFVGYPGYLLAFGDYTIEPLSHTATFVHLFWTLALGFTGVSNLPALASPIWCYEPVKWFLQHNLNTSHLLSGTISVLIAPFIAAFFTSITAWATLGSLRYCSKYWTISTGIQYEDYAELFPPNTTLHYIVIDGFEYSARSLLFVIVLIVGFVFYWFVFFEPTSVHSLNRMRVATGNLLFSCGIFIWYLVVYDPQQTTKPGWTEWLG